MHIGFSSMNTPHDPTPVELATALEERGFESLWYGEHAQIPTSCKTAYPGGGDLPAPYRYMADPYVSLAAAASVTSKLKLGTGIALLMERDIFSLAKTIATLDRLSGGRLLIGAGVGWNEEEFTNVSDQPWNKRYSVMRETVEALRTIWRDEEPEYHGNFIDFDPVWCNPKPCQSGGPAIVFGAMGPVGIGHAAQWADGWLPVDIGLTNIKQQLASFRQLLVNNGRDPDSVAITVQTMITPDLDKLKQYRDLGIARIIVGVAVDRWDKPEQVMPMIDTFGELIVRLAQAEER